jgi:basic membrane protein A
MSNNNTLYGGIVVALIIGVAVGWVIYPTMNPVSTDEMVSRTLYNAALDDVATAQTNLAAAIADAAADLAAAQTDITAAEADVASAEADLASAEAELDALKAPKKVGLVLATGGLGDKSFNDISLAGCQKAKDELGVDFDYVETTAISEYEGYQRDFAMSGEYMLIICIGYDQAEGLAIVAEEFPDQNFVIIDMFVGNPNVASLTFRANEGSYLVGVVAGMMSETGTIGFIGGMEDPLILDFYNGYKAGAIWANPAVTVAPAAYVGSFGDPVAAKELTIAQIELGIDSVYQCAGKSGLGALEAAHDAGVDAYGVDLCQDYLYDEMVASLTKRVDKAVFEMILDALVDKFQAGFYSGGIAEGWIGMCRLPEEEAMWEELFDFEHDPLPADVLAKVKEARDGILSGDITVPTGYD